MLKKSLIIISILLFAFSLWTIPIRNGNVPFGEGDTAWHYAYSELTMESGRLLKSLPVYLTFLVSDEYSNKYYGKAAIYYPPFFHAMAAIPMSMFSNPIATYFYFSVFISLLSIFSVFLLMDKLYGMNYAIIASLLSIYGVRSFMSLYWGQHPTFVSFSFIPIIIYSVYCLWTTNKNRYLILLFGCLVCQFFIHPLPIVLSSIFLLLFVFTMVIMKTDKFVKLVFNKRFMVYLLVLIGLSLLICMPYLKVYTGYSQGKFFDKTFINQINLRNMVGWYFNDPAGFPSIFFNYSKIYLPCVVLLVVLGIYAMYRKHDNLSNIMVILWIVSVYISVRLYMLGLYPYGLAIRFFYAETALFSALIAIGIMFLLEKIKSAYNREWLTIACILLIICLLLFKVPMFESIYPGEYRVNTAELDAVTWLKHNVPINAQIYSIGVSVYSKDIWFNILSHRKMFYRDYKGRMQPDYLFIDYTDILYMNDTHSYNYLRNFETKLLNNETISLNFANKQKLKIVDMVYDKNNIRIYEVASI